MKLFNLFKRKPAKEAATDIKALNEYVIKVIAEDGNGEIFEHLATSYDSAERFAIRRFERLYPNSRIYSISTTEITF